MQKNTFFTAFFIAVLLASQSVLLLAQGDRTVHFTVSMDSPGSHRFHVVMECTADQELVNFKMPAWSPGYYQFMNFADAVDNFVPRDTKGNLLKWEKKGKNSWQVAKGKTAGIKLEYDIKTTRQFVGTSYVDQEHGYIVPAGVFLYIADELSRPARLVVRPFGEWGDVATGLDLIPGSPFTYTAPDFDVLYDCPILIGDLETLPGFEVKGIPHHFVGFKTGEFDKVQFMKDLKKIVETASGLIGDIPYKHYTFLAIGPGRGGIEHLNSTAISFEGSTLSNPEGRMRMLSFITHEYYHHYNVKRIRPFELGPFDYDHGSKTNMLWVSEGISVYYEPLILNRAGLMTSAQVLEAFKSIILSFETQPGRFYQSLAQASAETWSDGPNGRVNDEFNKTISYYAKGPIVGMMLDFKIRHETNNKKSLDDVMRTLYQEFYRKQKRGFTETEFRKVCEKTAGRSLDELFHYVYTTKEMDYTKYFGYAGLEVDVTPRTQPGAYLGVLGQLKNDTLVVTSVDWNSPAWKAGIRRNHIILDLDDAPVSDQNAVTIVPNKKAGDKVSLNILKKDARHALQVTLGTKSERSFNLKPMASPDKLQASILKEWIR